LLDAPCSGSGTENVFENNFSEELIKRSRKAQENLLMKALNILKTGGEMIYSTCSILKKENEEIIEKALESNKIEIIPIKLDSPIPLLPVTVSGTICVCPTELYEGFFVAKLKKVK